MLVRSAPACTCCLLPVRPRLHAVQAAPIVRSSRSAGSIRAAAAPRFEGDMKLDRRDRGAEASTSGSIGEELQALSGSRAGRLALPSAEAFGSTLLLLGGLSLLLHSDTAMAGSLPDVGGQPHHTANVVFGDLASEDDFWGNVAAYGRFFVTVMLGTANIVTKPFRDAAKKPGRALFVGVGALVLFVFMTVTVRLMLGMNDDQNFEYLSRGI